MRQWPIYSLVYSKAWVNATRQPQGVSTKREFLEHRHTALTAGSQNQAPFHQKGGKIGEGSTSTDFRVQGRRGKSVQTDSGPIAACAPWAWHHIVWRNLISKTLSPLVKKLITYSATRSVKNAGKIDGKNTLFAVRKLSGVKHLEHLVKYQTFRLAVMWRYQLKHRASRTFPLQLDLLQVYSQRISRTANRAFCQ